MTLLVNIPYFLKGYKFEGYGKDAASAAAPTVTVTGTGGIEAAEVSAATERA